MKCELIVSEKGKPLLLLDGFKFTKSHVSKCGKIRWKCSNRKCCAKVYSNLTQESVVIEDPLQILQHNHGQSDTLGRQIISNSVKRVASDNLTEKPSKLICNEIRNVKMYGEDLSAEDISYIRKNIYQARRKSLPKLPKNLDDAVSAVRLLNLVTNKMEPFVLSSSDSDKCVVFSCFTNLRFLCNCEIIYMDGTFNYCTKYFTQMFTVHGFKNGYYIPLVFGLLPDKKTETYVNFFKTVIYKCNEFNLELKPAQIVIDFEQAIHLSCKQVFGDANILGCRFHLAQCWYRKIQSLGLIEEYKRKESVIGQFIRVLFGVQFLNCDEVQDFFNNELFFLTPRDGRVTELLKYLHENYVSNDSHFPPKIWACKSDVLYRTTNCCESFHSKFNATFYCSHPNLVQFCYSLLDFQIDTYAKINSANRGIKSLRPETRRRQQYLRDVMSLYDQNLITRFYYVKKVSYNYSP